MSISFTRSSFMTRTGMHSGLEKHRFHQAEEPFALYTLFAKFCFSAFDRSFKLNTDIF